ncbi:MAG: hypothetical protein KAR20_18075 [Candidatus Heimdallarchaeota archaeon]|nr:hypothetical protein [Candidatus Heimdallarchaeota archaeon]
MRTIAANKKWYLHPGREIRPDGSQSKRISPRQLAKLYGVKWEDCVIERYDGRAKGVAGLVHLYPRNDGVYKTPKEFADG